MLNSVKHEKSFITSGPGLNRSSESPNDQESVYFMIQLNWHSRMNHGIKYLSKNQGTNV